VSSESRLQYTAAQALEPISIQKVQRLLNGWLVRHLSEDLAIDMEVNVVEEQIVTNRAAWLQIKARSVENVDAPSQRVSLQTKHLAFYQEARLPVLVVLYACSRHEPLHHTCSSIFAQQYIQDELAGTGWDQQDSITVTFRTPFGKQAVEDAIAQSGRYILPTVTLETVGRATRECADRLRGQSFDALIRDSKPGAIVPAQYVRYEPQVDSFGRPSWSPVAFPAAELLASPLPTLILGEFGQGKTSAAIELAEHLLSSPHHLPVLITGDEINLALHNQLGSDAETNDTIVARVLSRNVSSLPESVLSSHRLVFIIDALDEIVSYHRNVLAIARNGGKLSKLGKVLLTSRPSTVQPFQNDAFETIHLDPTAPERNLETYFSHRLSSEDQERVTRWVAQQEIGIRSNYFLLKLMTDLYLQRPRKLTRIDQPLSESDVLLESIRLSLYEQKLAKRWDLRQRPRPYAGETKGEVTKELAEYEDSRAGYLAPLLEFLQRVSAYMVAHDKKGLEYSELLDIVHTNWNIIDHFGEDKRRHRP